MKFILDFLYLFAVIGYSPKAIYRTIKHKRYRTGWSERFGNITRKNPEKECIWLHAVSVGEVNASKSIIDKLEKRYSDYEIIISTTTDTGFARANNIFSNNHVFYFPFDFSLIMHRAFKNIRPKICILMELEVWPNFVSIAGQLEIPVIVVNGRISEKSFSGYKKIRWFARKVFGKLSLILAQTHEYAERFKELGAPAEKVIVTGSLKYDTAQITDKVEGTEKLALQLNITDGRLWVAGATGNDEESILLDVYQELKKNGQFSDLRIVIVPRKPERFNEVAQLIQQRGFPLICYSHLKDKNVRMVLDKNSVILGDTMGDLRKFYCLANIIFVGRSLVRMGGSDMMEASALGKCTMFGPYAFNFKQTVTDLLANNGAIMVENHQKLLKMMEKCLLEPDYAKQIGANGQEVIRKNQGATIKTIEQIAKFL